MDEKEKEKFEYAVEFALTEVFKSLKAYNKSLEQIREQLQNLQEQLQRDHQGMMKSITSWMAILFLSIFVLACFMFVVFATYVVPLNP